MMGILTAERAGHSLPTGPVDPAVLGTPGLVVLGITALAVSLCDAEIVPPAAGALLLLTLCGGLGQLLVAARDWRRGNIFSATVFAAYGLFWLSLIPLVILPRAGQGASPQAQALSAYLAIWGIFSIVLFRSFAKNNRSMRVMFGFLASFLLLAATGAATQSIALQMTAGYVGILFGIDAVVVGFVRNRSEKGQGHQGDTFSMGSKGR
jgi:hypothetical protein